MCVWGDVEIPGLVFRCILSQLGAMDHLAFIRVSVEQKDKLYITPTFSATKYLVPASLWKIGYCWYVSLQCCANCIRLIWHKHCQQLRQQFFF